MHGNPTWLPATWRAHPEDCRVMPQARDRKGEGASVLPEWSRCLGGVRSGRREDLRRKPPHLQRVQAARQLLQALQQGPLGQAGHSKAEGDPREGKPVLQELAKAVLRWRLSQRRCHQQQQPALSRQQPSQSKQASCCHGGRRTHHLHRRQHCC